MDSLRPDGRPMKILLTAFLIAALAVPLVADDLSAGR